MAKLADQVGAVGQRIAVLGRAVGRDGRGERQRVDLDTQFPAFHQPPMRLQPDFDHVRGIILSRPIVSGVRPFNEVEHDDAVVR